MPSALERRRGAERVAFDHRAAFDDDVDALENADVPQRIGANRHEIAVATGQQRADAVIPAHVARCGTGRRFDRLHRRHATFDHDAKLPCVEPMRIHAGVGGKDDGHAKLHGTREGAALRFGGVDVFLQEFGRPALSTTLGIDVIAVVDVHRQRDVLRARQQ